MAERYLYIHGVLGDQGSQLSEYERFRLGLVGRGVLIPPVLSEYSIPIEWGWDTPAAGETAKLARAQSRLKELSHRAPRDDRFSVRGIAARFFTRPIRDLFMLGPSDIAYYISPEGERRVRATIWNTFLRALVASGEDEIELNVIAHSAGCLIAHDFLFWLFSGKRSGRWADVCPEEHWERARSICRLRRLVTLGSPFAPLLVRSPDLVDRIAAEPGPWLDPADVGLVRGPPGSNPVWLNLWDEHDVAAFPMAGIYRSNRVIDVYTDHSDWPTRAHGLYWRSTKVHEVVARHWDD